MITAESREGVTVKASPYLVGSREDGHEATQHRGADAGDVDERPLKVTDRHHAPTGPHKERCNVIYADRHCCL